MENREALVAELRALRRGRGLTLARLAESPAVMEALGRPPVKEAYNKLVDAIESLGKDVKALALRNAYAIGMSAPGTLTRRRNDFAVEYRYNVETVENYENRMVDELIAQIQASISPMDDESTLVFGLEVMACVHNGVLHLTSYSTVGAPRVSRLQALSSPHEYRPPVYPVSEWPSRCHGYLEKVTGRSINAIIYTPPRDPFTYESLNIMVRFHGTEPAYTWQDSGTDLRSLGRSNELNDRWPPLLDSGALWRNPVRDTYYVFGWSMD